MRIPFAFANRWANDIHTDVIRIIAYQHRIPIDQECWEAFQPKLYYVTVAAILQLFPVLPQDILTCVAQGVNCVAGVATLFLVLSFLRSLAISQSTRVAIFALVALNPTMISMSVQATNDAFVVLFGSVAIFWGHRFFHKPQIGSFLGMTAGALLAGISKGNGLVVSLAITCLFVVYLVHPPGGKLPGRLRMLAFAAAFTVAFCAFVPVLGGYWSKYRYREGPFATNLPPARPPLFWEKTPVRGQRLGIRSVVDGFFTFRLIGMLQEPIVTFGEDEYADHRASLWSQLYGTMHSAHFHGWPMEWVIRSEVEMWTVRLTLVLALIPTMLLVAGTLRAFVESARWAGRVHRNSRRPEVFDARQIREDTASQTPASKPRENGASFGATALTRWVTRHNRPGFGLADLYLLVTAVGYVAFIITYAYRYREYPVMKGLFLYPGLLAFMAFAAAETDRYMRTQRPAVRRILLGISLALCAAYLADITEIVYCLTMTEL